MLPKKKSGGRARKKSWRAYSEGLPGLDDIGGGSSSSSSTRYDDPEAGRWAANPRRRRRKNSRYSYKGRRTRRNTSQWLPDYSPSYNPSHIPSYAMNGGMMGAVTSGFKPSAWMPTLPIVGGAITNAMLSNFIASQSFIPSIMRGKWGGYALGLMSAGLLGAGTGTLFPRYAGPVFFGGVVQVMTGIFSDLILPAVSQTVSTVKGMMGMSDYLTTQNAASARPLGGMADYLTPMNAASARPLGYFPRNKPNPAYGWLTNPGLGRPPAVRKNNVPMVPYEGAAARQVALQLLPGQKRRLRWPPPR